MGALKAYSSTITRSTPPPACWRARWPRNEARSRYRQADQAVGTNVDQPLADGHGPPEEVALHRLAAAALQEFHLLKCLDAFGHHTQLQQFGQCRFPFTLSLLRFQLAQLTFSSCHRKTAGLVTDRIFLAGRLAGSDLASYTLVRRL